MNKNAVFSITGRILELESALLLLPALVGILYQEKSSLYFVLTSAIALALGLFLSLVFKQKNGVIYAREGFLTVALAWIVMSAVGALPFTLSGEIPSYIDALFETVSGFTTTGASILSDVEALSKCMLFWRSFTHWLGGMGVLVFVMAIIPNVSDRSIHIMRAEMPGPVVGKLVPKAKDTAKILYLIYFAITLVEIVFLRFGGVDLFESVVYSLGTAGTGGFGIKADSLASYSPYVQWVITVFMLIFGVNFNLYYLMLLRKFRYVSQSGELWTYLGTVLASVILICANTAHLFANVSDSIRASAFQVASIITTTGYSTVDFNLWPSLSKGILLILMLMGGCAGSTAGGLKVSRVCMLFKIICREIKRLIHPRSVSTVRCEGKTVDESTLQSTQIYFSVYIVLIIAVFFLLSFDCFDIETNVSAAISCFNNIGPAFGAAGPMSSYAAYSDFSKVVLTIAMLLGRLEIYPLLIAVIPGVWSRKN